MSKFSQGRKGARDAAPPRPPHMSAPSAQLDPVAPRLVQTDVGEADDSGRGRTYRVLAKALVKESFALDSRRIGTLSRGEFVGPVTCWRTNMQTGQLRLQLPGGRGWTSVVSRDGTELLRQVDSEDEAEMSECYLKQEESLCRNDAELSEQKQAEDDAGGTPEHSGHRSSTPESPLRKGVPCTISGKDSADLALLRSSIVEPTASAADSDKFRTSIVEPTPAVNSANSTEPEPVKTEPQLPNGMDGGTGDGCGLVWPAGCGPAVGPVVGPAGGPVGGGEGRAAGKRPASNAIREQVGASSSTDSQATDESTAQPGRTNRRAIQQPSRYRQAAEPDPPASKGGVSGSVRRGSGRSGRGGRGSSVQHDSSRTGVSNTGASSISGSSSVVSSPAAHLASKSSAPKEGVEDAADMEERYPELWSRLPVRDVPVCCRTHLEVPRLAPSAERPI